MLFFQKILKINGFLWWVVGIKAYLCHRKQKIRFASDPVLNNRRYSLNTFYQETDTLVLNTFGKASRELTTHKTHQGHSSGAGRCRLNPFSFFDSRFSFLIPVSFFEKISLAQQVYYVPWPGRAISTNN